MKAGVMKRAAHALPSAEIAGVALWRRVADHLEHAIADGRYPVDTRLPGEIEIAQRLGVNRHTVRRALVALADRGFVRAERGSGTYVETRRLRYPISSRTRFSEIVGAAGREPGGRLLASMSEEAEPDVARRLAIVPRTKVIRIDILRSVDRVPVSAATTWLPAEHADFSGHRRRRGRRAAAHDARPAADRRGQHGRHGRRAADPHDASPPRRRSYRAGDRDLIGRSHSRNLQCHRTVTPRREM